MTEKIECQYCNEKFSKRGLPTHEKYCDERVKNNLQPDNKKTESKSKEKPSQKSKKETLPRHVEILKKVLKKYGIKRAVVDALMEKGIQQGKISPTDLYNSLKNMPSGTSNDQMIKNICDTYQYRLKLNDFDSYPQNLRKGQGQGFQPVLTSGASNPGLLNQIEIVEKIKKLTENDKNSSKEVKELRKDLEKEKEKRREAEKEKEISRLEQKIDVIEKQQQVGRSQYDLMYALLKSLDSKAEKAMNARMHFLGLTPQKRAEKRPSQGEKAEEVVDAVEFIEDEEMIEE